MYSENVYNVLNCLNIAKHRVLPELLRFNLTSAGNAGCLERALQWYSKCLCGEFYENIYTYAHSPHSNIWSTIVKLFLKHPAYISRSGQLLVFT
jgi:hypothetical protein